MSDGRSVPEHLAGARLTVDLGALAANYRTVAAQLKGRATAGAVVKADAYGIGIAAAAPALWAAGAREFFTAHPGEALALRKVLPDAAIYVLNGALPGAEDEYRAHRLIPALNTLGDVARWRDYCTRAGSPLPAALHLDTGMCRLGLDRKETAALFHDPDLLAGLDIALVMSHLASADEQDNPQNREQLTRFHDIRARLPMGRASFANSSGVFRGPEYHYDLARPGVALYGVNPTPWTANPMAQVVRLQAKILQVRDVDLGETVGYGASHRVGGPSRIATLPVGYADGFLRALSNRAKAFIGDREVALVGRVSMDLITLDVTGLSEAECHAGTWVDLIGPHQDVDALASQAGTIGYEILTSLGRRYHRVYTGAPS